MEPDKKSILLRVVTPGGVVLEEKEVSVVLRTATGEIQVLHGHAPIVVLLEPGELRAVDPSGNERAFAAGEGFAEIDGETVTVFSDLAEAAESISLEQAEEAKRRAESALADAAKMTDDERQAADLALRESMVKIQMLLRRKDQKGGPSPLR
ncbi:MAG TPA: ATP synthase F1 subunit epsilon [Chthoniobacteraceae bacterium]|jgi:F-type H+-transporting ATPase subunit epsilon|nr:ATP synthase F1 subunit epsilon [Chthoniobacteraceae bacterium]